MISAVRHRRAWVAVLLVLLFTPVTGMAYLNRGWAALLYLGIFLAGIAVVAMVYPQTGSVAELLDYARYAVLGVTLAGVLHAIWIARRRDPSRVLRWYARFWHLIALIFLLLLTGLWGLRTFAYEPVTVSTTSMTPSINFRDQILISRFRARDSHPERGDVVILYNTATKGRAIKRVVGMPGDSIQMQGGVLYINGWPVALRRLPDALAPCGERSCLFPQYEESLPGGHQARILNREAYGISDNTDLYFVPEDGYFVLGDDRDNSFDSRHSGPVLRRDLQGVVIARYIVDGRWAWKPVN